MSIQKFHTQKPESAPKPKEENRRKLYDKSLYSKSTPDIQIIEERFKKIFMQQQKIMNIMKNELIKIKQEKTHQIDQKNEQDRVIQEWLNQYKKDYEDK